MVRRTRPRPKSPSLPYDDTKVTADKSRAEITSMLEQRGLDVEWTTGSGGRSRLRFKVSEAMVCFVIDPMAQSPEPPRTRGKATVDVDVYYERHAKRLHRTLFWGLKSRFEMLDAGLETESEVWIGHVEIGNVGYTIGHRLGPTLEAKNLVLALTDGSK